MIEMTDFVFDERSAMRQQTEKREERKQHQYIHLSTQHSTSELVN